MNKYRQGKKKVKDEILFTYILLSCIEFVAPLPLAAQVLAKIQNCYSTSLYVPRYVPCAHTCVGQKDPTGAYNCFQV